MEFLLKARHIMCKARCAAIGSLLIYALLGCCLHICAQETLPIPPQPSDKVPSSGAAERNFYCPTFDNRPLTALTVDTRPLDLKGNLVSEADLPLNCMPAPATEPFALFPSSGNFDCACRDVLQLARFWHPQLFFEDPVLERYGMDYVCPSFHALGEFTCDLALLPARLLVNKRRPCMKTPTPHCFSACGICGY
jgi:hypothetical protein